MLPISKQFVLIFEKLTVHIISYESIKNLASLTKNVYNRGSSVA